jgi:hypothetical protein
MQSISFLPNEKLSWNAPAAIHNIFTPAVAARGRYFSHYAGSSKHCDVTIAIASFTGLGEAMGDRMDGC